MPEKIRPPMESSGIFYDSADLIDFEKWLNTHIISGATTNPVLFEIAGVLDVVGHIAKMIDLSGPGFPISIELPDADMNQADMIQLALRYRDRFPNNAVIKVPMKPDEPQKAFEVIYRLGQEGVRVNATIGITMGQLISAAEAARHSRADGDNYVSLFWGRRDEAKRQIIEAQLNQDPDATNLRDYLEKQIPDAAATLAMTLKYLENHSLNTKIIVGSIRNPYQIEQAFFLGADIVTIPPKLLSDWMFTQRGMETVDQFNQAYRSVADKIKLI